MAYRLLLAYLGVWYRLGVFRWHRLRSLREWIDCRLLIRFGLFDSAFYLEVYPDVCHAGLDPIHHFISHGRQERRKPHLLFDTHYYVEQMPVADRHMLPAIHFILFGRFSGLSPNRWFDPVYYMQEASDWKLSVGNSFFHYLEYGNLQNIRPSSAFNPEEYLQQNQEVGALGYSAMEHFIRGEPEKESGRLGSFSQLPAPRHIAKNAPPSDPVSAIRALPPALPQNPDIDVIVPVYGAANETLSCLYHVLSADNLTVFRLVVVDDCSPDAELTKILKELADEGYFQLIYHEKNLGFVNSVNDGMELDENTDVILLNSDTEVYGDWIDRLRRVAEAGDDISTVTPLTNSGTICSYPIFPEDNPGALEISYEELDRVAAAVNGDKAVTIPTAVGFCMLIKHAAISQVGLFDVEAFGRGYGEENDFCLRARQVGWRDVAAPGVFVRHLGSMSFAGEKGKRVEAALQVIRARYPFYEAEVRQFVARDPLKPYRFSLDMHRLSSLAADRNVLIVSHARGGGTEQCVRDETEKLEKEGFGVFRLVPAAGNKGEVYVFHRDLPTTPNISVMGLVTDIDALSDLIKSLRISKLQVHHAIDFGSNAVNNLKRLVDVVDVPYTVYVHDYFGICPRVNLADETGFYCGEPASAGCNRCLRERGSSVGQPDIDAWRNGYRRLLGGADSVVAPSQDVARRLNRYFAEIVVNVVPHEDNVQPAAPRPPRNQRPLRIGVVGAISAVKGFHILSASVAWAKKNMPDVQFIVLGYTEDDLGADRSGIEIAGPYAHDRILEEIDEQAFDLIFQPSVCPESYSYVLSSALQTGLPIAVFDIGAPADRLSGVPQGLIMPLELAKDPPALVKRLVQHAEIANGGGEHSRLREKPERCPQARPSAPSCSYPLTASANTRKPPAPKPMH